MFKTARDSGVSIAAATQALSDFRTADFDYRPVVLENVRMLNIFRAQDAEGHDLIVRNSGQRIRLLATEGEATNAQGTSRSRQIRETLVPRLDAEEIERVNQDPDLSIISVTPGAGFAQFRPLIMRTYYHIGGGSSRGGGGSRGRGRTRSRWPPNPGHCPRPAPPRCQSRGRRTGPRRPTSRRRQPRTLRTPRESPRPNRRRPRDHPPRPRPRARSSHLPQPPPRRPTGRAVRVAGGPTPRNRRRPRRGRTRPVNSFRPSSRNGSPRP